MVPHKVNVREKDRLRKAESRLRIALAHERPDFNGWFRAVIDETFSTSRNLWSQKLAAMHVDGIATAKQLTRYYNGQTGHPGPSAAYALGWALNDFGIEWCSGPVCLLAAGHYESFFRIIAFMSMFENGRIVALRFAFATEYACASKLSYDESMGVDASVLPKLSIKHRRMLEEDRARHLTKNKSHNDLARAQLRLGSTVRDIIEESWKLALRRKTLPAASLDFRFAVKVMAIKECATSLRYDAALQLLVGSVRRRGSSEEIDVVRRLLPLTRIYSLEDMGEDLYRDPVFMQDKLFEIQQRMNNVSPEDQ